MALPDQKTLEQLNRKTLELEAFAKTLYNENDRDAETFASLGGAFRIGKLTVPYPCPGVFSLLEIWGSPFLSSLPVEEITIEDFYKALWLLTERENALSADIDLKPIEAQTGPLSPDYLLAIAKEIKTVFNLSYTGFELLPGSGETSDKNERIFDALWLAGIVSKVHQITGRNEFYIKWRMPLAEIGFYIAQYAKENGEKGIGRRHDEAAMLNFLKPSRPCPSVPVCDNPCSPEPEVKNGK
jgi:hypothetical protein